MRILRSEGRGCVDFRMPIQEWEAVSATLLWINLKSGVLPIGSEIHGVYKGKPPRRGNVLTPLAVSRIRLARVNPRSIRTQDGVQRCSRD
jgi:hypothetical protein